MHTSFEKSLQCTMSQIFLGTEDTTDAAKNPIPKQTSDCEAWQERNKCKNMLEKSGERVVRMCVRKTLG
jgi:hypothetical protein